MLMPIIQAPTGSTSWQSSVARQITSARRSRIPPWQPASGFALDPIQASVDEHTSFLPKPYAMAQLLTAISDLLNRS